MADGDLSREELQRAIEELNRRDLGASLDRQRELREAQRRIGVEGVPETDDDIMASFVGQESLGEATPDPGLRALLSIAGDTFEEQRLAFSQRNPQGEMVRVPAFNEILYRNSPDEPFRKLDVGFFELMDIAIQDAAEFYANRPRGDPGRRVGEEIAADVADIAGDIPEIIGETATLVAFRRPGAGVMEDISRMAVGAAGGEAAQQFGQTIAGTQLESIEQQRRRVAGATIESIIGGTIGAGIGGAVNTVMGRGISNVPLEGVEAIAAAERIGTLPLLPSQVSDVPIIKLLGRQSQALVSRIGRYLTEQERRTTASVRALVDPQARRQFITQTVNAVNQASKDIIDLAIQGAAITRPRSFRDAGRALQQGITEWWRATGVDVDNLYRTARSLEEPTFDATVMIDEAKALVAGVEAQTAAGGTVRAGEIDPALFNLAQRISQLDPATQTVESLRAFRQEIGDLTVPGIEGPRLGTQQALGLRGAINAVLRDPLNTNPAFRRAWSAADDAASRRFTTREQAAIVDITRHQSPSVLARELAKPGQLDNLAIIRQALERKSPEHWQRFTEAFRADLVSEPGNITARLDAFDRPTLNVLMTSQQQATMRAAGRQIDRLTSTGVQQARRNQTEIRNFFQNVFDSRNTAGIDALFDIMQKRGGKDTPFGRSTRATIIDEAIRRSTVREQGVDRIDFNRLTSTLDDFEGRGVLRFLKPEEVGFLRDVQTVQDFSRLGVAGAGTSIQAAEAAASARTFSGAAIMTIVENMGVGWWVTSAPGRRVLIGAGRNRPLDMRMIRNIGAASANIVSDAERQQQLGEDFESLVRAVALIPGQLIPVPEGFSE
ncbi:MAG: hypothetical protein ACR2Q4_12715 [Geminicoccaceae bacterium]